MRISAWCIWKDIFPCSILPLSFKCRRSKKVRSDVGDAITRKSLFVPLWMWYCSSLTVPFGVRMKLKQCCCRGEGPSPWWGGNALTWEPHHTTGLWRKTAAVLSRTCSESCLQPAPAPKHLRFPSSAPTRESCNPLGITEGVSYRIEVLLMADDGSRWSKDNYLWFTYDLQAINVFISTCTARCVLPAQVAVRELHGCSVRSTIAWLWP